MQNEFVPEALLPAIICALLNMTQIPQTSCKAISSIRPHVTS